ncbi:MAG TPA: acetate uptake transporter [Ktedonobacteraceae bacterium]|nr:acetate uptake transporter [Ktedonobacteraceae bacterium]
MAQIAADSERTAPVAVASANPAPLGLCGFALTTFVLSSINAGWFPAGATTIIIGLALFYGGIAQLLAGMWEFKAGNTFGATAFTSYGAFWLSLGVVFVPGSGILAGMPASALPQALGLFLLAWTIFTGLMFLGTFKSNIALIAVFGFLFVTFLLLTIGELGPSTGAHQWGGYFGVITAILAWYTALSGILTSTKSPFQLPVFPLS